MEGLYKEFNYDDDSIDVILMDVVITLNIPVFPGMFERS